MAGRFCVVLRHAGDDADAATMAFITASAAVASEKETLVFLTMDGVLLSQEGAIGMVRELTNPQIGTYQTLGVPWLFSETPASVHATAPSLGQHTDEVLAGAGYTPQAIGSLRQAGVIR